MTEEVEKGSRVPDLAGAEAIAEAYPGAADPDIHGRGRAMGPQLEHEEKEAIGFLADLGFEYISHDKANLTFRRSRDNRSPLPSSPRRSFPRAQVPMLLAQFGGKVEEHPTVTGLMIPSRGYVELICSRLEPTVARRAFRLEFNELDCAHKEPAKGNRALRYQMPRPLRYCSMATCPKAAGYGLRIRVSRFSRR